MRIPGPAAVFTAACVAAVVWLGVSASANAQEAEAHDLKRLRVLREDQYPHAVFFRRSEQSARGDFSRYEEWAKRFSQLMGVVGKVWRDEVRGPYERVRRFFTRLKIEHPEQLYLVHFRGMARDPRFRREPFFAGHWMYYNGATIEKDVPEVAGITEIKVSDSTLFKLNQARKSEQWHITHHDDVGLCELDENGEPNWRESEQVKLLDVDHQKGTITVMRAQFGTKPHGFEAGEAYAAAHSAKGPSNPRSYLGWRYNYSTQGPEDAHGRKAYEVLAEQIAGWYQPDGPLAHADGIEFDVLHHVARHIDDGNRGMDMNADGERDDGIFNGIQTYGLGVYRFLEQLRREMGPDRLVMADGNYSFHQRGFGLLNGIESEQWPSSHDPGFDGWAGGINRFRFWAANARSPVFQYVARPERERYTELRLVFAGAVFSDAALAPHNFIPEPEPGEPIGVFDELRKGTEWEIGWLGRPLEPARHVAFRQPDLLAEVDLAEHLAPLRGSAQVRDGEIHVRAENAEEGPLRFQLRNLPCDGRDLYVRIVASAEPMSGYPQSMARILYVNASAPDAHGNRETGTNEDYSHIGRDPKKLHNMTWVNGDAFESGFYFKRLKRDQERATLTVSIESTEPVTISDIRAYAAPDAMYRRFEKGLVLANPSEHEYTFDLERIWPGERFRRLRGSSHQDPETNNGRPVGAEVTLEPREGLFLVRQ